MNLEPEDVIDELSDLNINSRHLMEWIEEFDDEINNRVLTEIYKKAKESNDLFSKTNEEFENLYKEEYEDEEIEEDTEDD